MQNGRKRFALSFSNKQVSMEDKLSWKEKMAAFMVLMIGTGYLMLTLLSFVSSKADMFTVSKEQVSISKAEFLSNFRSILYVIIGIVGGILLFRRKTLGWIMGVPLLSIFLVLVGFGLYYYIEVGEISFMSISVAITLLLFVLSLIFLLLPSARKKYKVSKMSFLLSLLFLVFLVVFNFVL